MGVSLPRVLSDKVAYLDKNFFSISRYRAFNLASDRGFPLPFLPCGATFLWQKKASAHKESNARVKLGFYIIQRCKIKCKCFLNFF